MMDVLQTVKVLNLPDWWICAGFVRSKIWDVLHDFGNRTHIPDVDVIYFDQTNVNEQEEKRLESQLRALSPTIPWSVKNQARMHVVNSLSPYSSSVEAISKFPESATALGLKLDGNDMLILTAPCGIDDVIQLRVKPTPLFKEKDELFDIFKERLIRKNWKATWGKIEIEI